jgi:sugar phosphate isomerase/epimerase
MMKTSTRTWTSILAAVAALGVAGSALAQPHRDDKRDDKRDDHRDDRGEPARPGAPIVAPPTGVAPPADPRIAERQHQLEDQRRKERLAAVKDVKTWNSARPQRAVQHRGEIASTWGNLVSRPEAQAELKTHADRMARLNRILDIANQKADSTLESRCQADIQKEVDRDLRAMQAIRVRDGVR